MSLTDTAIRNAKPRTKPFKLADERGLFLEVTPAGSRRWRFRYYFQRKEKLLSLGLYPDVSLAQARERRDAARKLLANGVDPSAARKAEKAQALSRTANTFEFVAREWHKKHSASWAPSNAARVLRRLELDVFPMIGSTPAAEVKAPDLLAMIRRIEARGVLAPQVKTRA